jgi:hypothetical protein
MSDAETSLDQATRGRALPGYYNDLDASLAHAWAMIGRGVADRRSAFHTPVVATVDETGAPSQRVMVLRAADGARRLLRLHTDARSQKLVQIAGQPRISLLFYDVGAKLQLRVAAHATVHAGDEVSASAWAASLPQSRLCYEQVVAPGAPIPQPMPELPADRRFAVADEGLENFAVLRATVDSIEWLYLAIEGHRRARWDYADGGWRGTWLAP